MKRYAVVVALMTASLGFGTGVAVAAPSPTPNGLIGSCNMVSDPYMVPTMQDVIAHAGLYGYLGNEGMHHSTVVSGCQAE